MSKHYTATLTLLCIIDTSLVSQTSGKIEKKPLVN